MTVSAVLPCCLSKVITQWAGRAKKLPQAATDNLLDKITLLPFTVPKKKKKVDNFKNWYVLKTLGTYTWKYTLHFYIERSFTQTQIMIMKKLFMHGICCAKFASSDEFIQTTKEEIKVQIFWEGRKSVGRFSYLCGLNLI